MVGVFVVSAIGGVDGVNARIAFSFERGPQFTAVGPDAIKAAKDGLQFARTPALILDVPHLMPFKRPVVCLPAFEGPPGQLGAVAQLRQQDDRIQADRGGGQRTTALDTLVAQCPGEIPGSQGIESTAVDDGQRPRAIQVSTDIRSSAPVYGVGIDMHAVVQLHGNQRICGQVEGWRRRAQRLVDDGRSRCARGASEEPKTASEPQYEVAHQQIIGADGHKGEISVRQLPARTPRM